MDDLKIRVAVLEVHVEAVRTDVRDLKTDVRDMRERLKAVEVKIDHLPSKGYINTAVIALFTLVTLLSVFQGQIQKAIAEGQANIVLAALTAAGWTLAPPGSRVVPEGGEWQPIETAPKNTDILAWNAVVGAYRTRWESGRWPCYFWSGVAARFYPEPSLWQPLPEPPALRALAEAKP